MKIISIFIACFSCAVAFSQPVTNTTRANQNNIYYHSLVVYLTEVKEKNNILYDSIYIQKDERFTDSLLRQSGHTSFVVLDFNQVGELLKKRKSLVLHQVSSLQYENGKFAVYITPYITSLPPASTEINIASTGVTGIFYRFVNERFVFTGVRNF